MLVCVTGRLSYGVENYSIYDINNFQHNFKHVKIPRTVELWNYQTPHLMKVSACVCVCASVSNSSSQTIRLLILILLWNHRQSRYLSLRAVTCWPLTSVDGRAFIGIMRMKQLCSILSEFHPPPLHPSCKTNTQTMDSLIYPAESSIQLPPFPYSVHMAAGSLSSPTEKLCHVIALCAIYKKPDSASLMIPFQKKLEQSTDKSLLG